jgi:hypothetical protein
VKTKSTAMGLLPFEFAPELTEKLLEFKDNKFNWIEMNVQSEIFKLVSFRVIKKLESVQQYVNPDDAA